MIITALDFNTAESALNFVRKVDPVSTRLKIGKELFTVAGPQLVEQLQKSGFDVFLDLKFHDIPNTVAGALKAAASMGVWMVNVHVAGGPRMLQAARAAIDAANSQTLLIGVTVLTSMDEPELQAVGVSCPVEEQVAKLSALAMESGLDGVVCSPNEVRAIKSASVQKGCETFLTVTPGVRPRHGTTLNADDQRRIMTPAEAKEAGSDYLVIGRPITQAEDPVAALSAIQKELKD